jgi:hypothetical protein
MLQAKIVTVVSWYSVTSYLSHTFVMMSWSLTQGKLMICIMDCLIK